MKHVFIVNKISGKGQAYQLVSLITDIAQSANLSYQIEMTQYQGHAREIAAKHTGEDVCIYSVGGDGTLSEILNGLDQKIALGVIPAGSGNDFYRLIGKDRDFRKIIRDTIDAPVKMIDIGTTDCLRFINTTSFGLDADINAKASGLIRKTIISKGPAYLFSILTNVINLHPKHVRLTIDGINREGDYLLIACMNGRFYGNGIPISPQSDVRDGYFELCLFKDAPRRKAYPFLAKFMQGKHLNYEGFELIKAKHIIIDSDREISCQSDGENYSATHMELKIKEGWLRLKAPSYLDIL